MVVKGGKERGGEGKREGGGGEGDKEKRENREREKVIRRYERQDKPQ